MICAKKWSPNPRENRIWRANRYDKMLQPIQDCYIKQRNLLFKNIRVEILSGFNKNLILPIRTISK
ncbi:hypothetical protein D5R40_24840 [Okeania hirsuta]|uniref:Uncharacterized protein n=1 Tax=Okeania hirsuta TaxID=1458930 RepID=A0A3N6QAG0_9CYAN|nr:hypothetical protein D5R40_24840 [Okeania hirsuta]